MTKKLSVFILILALPVITLSGNKTSDELLAELKALDESQKERLSKRDKTADDLLDELKYLEENWEGHQKKIKREAENKARRQIIKEATKPIIGMWGSEYIQRFGSPDRKKITKSEYGSSGYYVYLKDGNIDRIVHLRDGKVTGYSDY
jgi:septal ring factor EnvC (AmiA/AmiB activator)